MRPAPHPFHRFLQLGREFAACPDADLANQLRQLGFADPARLVPAARLLFHASQ